MCVNVNIFAILVSVVIAFPLGYLWYGPLFGKQWMNFVGLKKEDVGNAEAAKGMISSIIASFIQAFSLSVILKLAGASGAVSGLLYGAVVGIAWIATTIWNNHVYEQRPFALTAINAGYRVIYFLIIGLLLGVWQ